MSAIATTTHQEMPAQYRRYIEEGVALGNKKAQIVDSAHVMAREHVEMNVKKVALPKPKQVSAESAMSIMLQLLATMAGIKETAGETAKLQLEEMKEKFSRLMEERINTRKKQDQKRLEQIEEARAQREASKKGGIFSSVFNWVTAAVDIVAGIAAIVGGVVTGQGSVVVGGAFLVVAGGCAIAAEICTYCGEDKAAQWLQVASALCSVIGAIAVTYGAAAAKGLAKEAGKAAAKEAVEESSEQLVRQAAQRAGKELSKEASEELVKKAVKEYWDDLAVEAAKKAAKDSGQKISEKGFKEIVENSVEEGLEEAGEKALHEFYKKKGKTTFQVLENFNGAKINILQGGGQVTQTAISMQIAALDNRVAELSEKIGQLKADVKENKALSAKLEALIERLMAFMQDLAASVTRAVKIVSDNVKDQAQTNAAIARRAVI